MISQRHVRTLKRTLVHLHSRPACHIVRPEGLVPKVSENSTNGRIRAARRGRCRLSRGFTPQCLQSTPSAVSVSWRPGEGRCWGPGLPSSSQLPRAFWMRRARAVSVAAWQSLCFNMGHLRRAQREGQPLRGTVHGSRHSEGRARLQFPFG